jgi:hypothetical protein
MTLADLTLPISYEDARQYALVFGDAIRARLELLQDQYGQRDCRIVPRVLADGRYMTSADLLTAIGPGQWMHAMWEAADKAALSANVEVIPWADAVAMLPADPNA